MKLASFLAAAVLVVVPVPASAWGFEGHQIVALIARAELTPAVRAKVDAILATDTDPLTEHDMASEATWADVYRSRGHRETAEWHFVDTEIDAPDLRRACFGFPAAVQPASTGPAQDCVVDKVREFAAELGALGTAPVERLLALKYLLHFVGDEHQPLHASDNHDRGGNCVSLALGGSFKANLHSYWDTAVVEAAVGTDPAAAATLLRARISPAQRNAWRSGDPVSWAQQSFKIAQTSVYSIGSPPGCPSDAVPIVLPPAYAKVAQTAATLQLQRAGIRLAAVLNRALGGPASLLGDQAVQQSHEVSPPQRRHRRVRAHRSARLPTVARHHHAASRSAVLPPREADLHSTPK
jgi:hypothetical protein